MHGKIIGLAAALALLSFAPAAHAGGPTIKVERDATLAEATEFSVGYGDTFCPPEGIGCLAEIHSSIDGGPVDDDLIFSSGGYLGDGEGATATYDWDCSRSGLHKWTILIRLDPVFTAGERPPVPDYVQSGTFRVPSCGKFRPRRVSKGEAAALAAQRYPREFVSSSRCRPRAALSHGRSSRWDCTVTHNNNIRVCRTVWSYRFEQRKKLDDIENRQRVRTREVGCRFF